MHFVFIRFKYWSYSLKKAVGAQNDVDCTGLRYTNDVDCTGLCYTNDVDYTGLCYTNDVDCTCLVQRFIASCLFRVNDR
jgi:hypothetical protein